MFDCIKKLISNSAAVLVLFIYFQILELFFSKGPFTFNFAAPRVSVRCSITVVC